MSTRKTSSLAVPADPLAALRALQELDTPRSPVPEDATALPVADATGSAPLPATGSAVGSATTPAESNEVANAGGSVVTRPRERDTSSATGSAGARSPGPRKIEPTEETADPPDPMAAAVRAMLGQPYSGEPAKGQFIVSTVKLPVEVWERLGWLSKWTGRAKQDIIADALKDHFAKIVKGR